VLGKTKFKRKNLDRYGWMRSYKMFVSSFSMIDTLASTIRSGSNPVVSSQIHILSFPFKPQIVSRRSRPLLNYFLFGRSCVFELGVRTKSMENILIFLLPFHQHCSHYSIKSVVTKWDGRMCSWSRLHWFSFLQLVSLFLMLLYPEFVSCFVHF